MPYISDDICIIGASGDRSGFDDRQVKFGMDLAFAGQVPPIPATTVLPETPFPSFSHVLVGSQRGVDRQVFHWAVTRELGAIIQPAKWVTGGTRKPRAEGNKRNAFMGAKWVPLAWLLFPGNSGTEDMANVLFKCRVPTWRWFGMEKGWLPE